MKKGIIIAFLLLPALCFCQENLNQTHAVVMANLKKQKGEKPVLSETDSTIRMTIKTNGANTVTHTYKFDKAGKCIMEKVVTTCDSCYKGLLNDLLKQGKYQWKKINENQYVSRFEDKLMVELPVEKNDFYYTIFWTDWNRTLYDMLTGK